MNVPTPARWPVDRCWLAGLTLGLLAVYAASAPRTVALEDDGEFILAGYFLGVAHPPGYPLHTLLSWLFTLLPFGSVAYRVHLLSGVFGALAAATLFACARRLDIRPVLAGAAALALGLSQVFWSQAIVAEVYTLHVFLFGVMLLLSLQLRGGSARPWQAWALAGVTGLGLANHWPLMVLAGPAVLLLVWPNWQMLLRPPVLLTGLVTTVVPYAWMALRSLQQPTINFYGPLRSLADLWHFVMRKGYAGVDRNPMAGWDDRLRFTEFLAGEWTVQLTAGGAGLALVGLGWLWLRGQRAIAAALAWSLFAVCALLLLSLNFEYFAQSAAAFRVYPLTAYFATALLLGCGLEALARRTSANARVRPVAPLLGAALVAALALGNAPANWRPHDDWGEAYALAILRETPPGAVLVVESDWAANTLGYAHFVDGHCPDCTLVHPQGLLFPSRLYDPVRTPQREQSRILAETLATAGRPQAYTDGAPAGAAIEDRWLVQVVTPGASPAESAIRLSASTQEFFRRYVARDNPRDATVSTVQQLLRRRYLQLLAAAGRLDAAQVESLCQEFHACLGLAEGALRRPAQYDAGQAERLLAHAAAVMPDDVHRWDRARILELRGLALARSERRVEAIESLRAAIQLAPEATVEARRGLAALGAGISPELPR